MPAKGNPSGVRPRLDCGEDMQALRPTRHDRMILVVRPLSRRQAVATKLPVWM